MYPRIGYLLIVIASVVQPSAASRTFAHSIARQYGSNNKSEAGGRCKPGCAECVDVECRRCEPNRKPHVVPQLGCYDEDSPLRGRTLLVEESPFVKPRPWDDFVNQDFGPAGERVPAFPGSESVRAAAVIHEAYVEVIGLHYKEKGMGPLPIYHALMKVSVKHSKYNVTSEYVDHSLELFEGKVKTLLSLHPREDDLATRNTLEEALGEGALFELDKFVERISRASERIPKIRSSQSSKSRDDEIQRLKDFIPLDILRRRPQFPVAYTALRDQLGHTFASLSQLIDKIIAAAGTWNFFTFGVTGITPKNRFAPNTKTSVGAALDGYLMHEDLFVAKCNGPSAQVCEVYTKTNPLRISVEQYKMLNEYMKFLVQNPQKFSYSWSSMLKAVRRLQTTRTPEIEEEIRRRSGVCLTFLMTAMDLIGNSDGLEHESAGKHHLRFAVEGVHLGRFHFSS
eukprot:TRINITY_DN49614_c0_g1_i1.p1 TRINITY_DN49614_c0_g1~~TRINITY_DN49614_c0_g1_i1.p1  ORF type:complete len:468 (-),score=43.42 TRINITY_DN49614_c0_g1_i1:311-1672(-)